MVIRAESFGLHRQRRRGTTNLSTLLITGRNYVAQREKSVSEWKDSIPASLQNLLVIAPKGTHSNSSMLLFLTNAPLRSVLCRRVYTTLAVMDNCHCAADTAREGHRRQH